MSEKDNIERQRQLLSDTRLTARTGAMPEADGYGRRESDCDDTIEIFLRMDGYTIAETSFLVRGCIFTLACGRAAAALAKGKTLAEARVATEPQAIVDALGGIPEENFHAAQLASDAAADAIADAALSIREPWRKVYRRRYC